MPQRIALDATPLLFPGCGVWRVTRALLETMLGLKSPYEFRLFARRFSSGEDVREIAGRSIERFHLPRSAANALRFLGLTELSLGADLYHATDHFTPLRNSSSAVATIHDMIFKVAPEPQFAKDNVFFNAHVPDFARRSRRIIAISDATKRDIIEQLKISEEKIDVIPWAVDRKTFYPSTDDAELRARLKATHGITAPYIFAVSCSEGRKNTPRLMDAYAQLVEKNPSLHMVVRWNAPAAFKEKYQRGKLAQYIHFTKPVDDFGLADLYRGATVMAFPSLYEGFGLPILEAMSCGTPAITSRNSSLPEVGGDAARYVDPMSTDSILEALTDFENNAPAVRGLREKGLAHADTFSWERTAQMTLDTYAKCLS